MANGMTRIALAEIEMKKERGAEEMHEELLELQRTGKQPTYTGKSTKKAN